MNKRNLRCVLFLLLIFFLISSCDKEDECNVTGKLGVSTNTNAPSLENHAAKICPGENVVLQWETFNADLVSLEANNVADVGSVEQQGTMQVSPTTSTTYELVTSSNNCQPMEGTPTVSVDVYTEPKSYSLRLGPDDENVPDWIGTIGAIQISEALVVTSIDSIIFTDADGNPVELCANWNRWSLVKDGSVQASSPLPALTNPPFNPAGSYRIRAVDANSSDDFNDLCVREYVTISMTFNCPSGN